MIEAQYPANILLTKKCPRNNVLPISCHSKKVSWVIDEWGMPNSLNGAPSPFIRLFSLISVWRKKAIMRLPLHYNWILQRSFNHLPTMHFPQPTEGVNGRLFSKLRPDSLINSNYFEFIIVPWVATKCTDILTVTTNLRHIPDAKAHAHTHARTHKGSHTRKHTHTQTHARTRTCSCTL